MAWIELHQELREHKKIYACAEMLKLSRVTMVGTIVSLWLWALDNVPDGSLNGVSNRTIARICDFPDRKADTLVSALTLTGWLDNSGGVLMIHDWNEYVGKLMDRRKKDRERKRKADGIPPEVQRKSVQIPVLQYPNSTITVQNQSISTPNTVDGSAPTAESPVLTGKQFTLFWESYPKKINREAAWNAWKTLNPSPDTANQILAALELYKKSSGWIDGGDRYIPGAANFLSKGYWQSPPIPGTGDKKKVPTGSGKLGEVEIANIRRLMQEDAT